MRILAIADEPSPRLWGDHCREALSSVDLILSAGDLPARYLSFLTCFTNAPVVYVHGNHDDRYDREPPEGCMSAEGKIVLVRGVRILGLGGSIRYRPDGTHMYTEKEMAARIRSLRRELKSAGGFDILLAHSPVAGIGDQPDLAHRGFECFKPLLRQYRPAVVFHGHVHQAYSALRFQRIRDFEGIPVINTCGAYEFDIPDSWQPQGQPCRWAIRRMNKLAEPGLEHF